MRFAGVPKDFRLTPTGLGDQRGSDSDPDFSGVTAPFTLSVGEPNIRPTTSADQVSATYINPTIDAGITPLRFGVGDRVWLDLNSDGIQQPDEPAGSAAVSLLSDTGDVVATTTTDRVAATNSPTCPAVGIDSSSRVCQRIARSRCAPPGATRLLIPTQIRRPGEPPSSHSLKEPQPDTGHGGRRQLDGLRESDTQCWPGVRLLVGDRVWRDVNGDGVFDVGDTGVGGITVQLFDSESHVRATTVTSESGHYTFYRLARTTGSDSKVPDGLRFTDRDVGNNPAVDSDAEHDGWTPLFSLGNDNPADPSIDAGLTTPANYRDASGVDQAPVDLALSSAGGVAPQVPFAGAALALAGASCLIVARRRRKL